MPVMARIGVLGCTTTLTVRWPDGGTSEAWTLAAGTPVLVELDQPGDAVRVVALDEPRAFADIPAGWLEYIEVSEDVPF